MGDFIGVSTFEYIIWGIVIFFVLREVFMWYWKINKIVALLEEIKENTKKETNKISS